MKPSWVCSLFLSPLVPFSCSEAWGALDDPADPKASNYQGYESLSDPDDIRAALPADGGTLSGTILTATKILGATAYELRLAASEVELDPLPLFHKADYSSNVMDISTASIQDRTSYWWKVRASVAGGPWEDWSAVSSFATAWEAAATPTFSPPGGPYTADQSATISCATSGATIWYTTDGSDPASSATRLSATSPVGPITAIVSPATRIRAVATAPLSSQSAEGSATYSIFSMISVPGGSFSMGSASSSDEQPIHSVALSSFLIGKFEVTQAQYRDVMGSNPSDFAGDSQPVEHVTWFNAVSFCNALSIREGLDQVYAIAGSSVSADFTKTGYRLPTEAEWEYAAGGGQAGHGYAYSGASAIGDVSWYSGNASDATHAAGGKIANELGIHDMSGNVWEWCWDRYSSSYYSSSPASDPTGPGSGSSRVLRGGSWGNSDVSSRVGNRSSDAPTVRNDKIGFRVARSAP